MKTRNTNKPVLIPCHSVGRLSGLFCWTQWQDINNCSVQRHSKICKSGMGDMGLMRLMGLIKNKKGPVEQHSKNSNFVICCSTCPSRTVDFGACPRRARTTTPKAIFKNGLLSGLLCWQQGQDVENSLAQPYSKNSKFRKNQTLQFLYKLHGEEMYSAQPYSKNSKWGIWLLRGLRNLGIQGQKNGIKNNHAQPYSKDNFVICCSTCPSRTVDFGTCPRRARTTTPKAIFENGRLSGLFCWPQGQDINDSSAQWDSKMTKSGMGALGTLGILRFMGRRHKIENSPAQPYSKFSNGRLSGLFCWPQGQNINSSSAQQDSNISKLKKNQTLQFLYKLHGEEMLSAQRHSKIYKSEKIKDKRKKIKGKA